MFLFIYGDSCDQCLHNLELVLERCAEKNLTLNWEKRHFMVQHGIVLGHEISRKGTEVDNAKIEVITKLPIPICVKDIRSFLGHTSFYRRFIKNFRKISRLLTNLLVKDIPFIFDDECLNACKKLKIEFIFEPIIFAPDWSKPFEIMRTLPILS